MRVTASERRVNLDGERCGYDVNVGCHSAELSGGYIADGWCSWGYAIRLTVPWTRSGAMGVATPSETAVLVLSGRLASRNSHRGSQPAAIA